MTIVPAGARRLAWESPSAAGWITTKIQSQYLHPGLKPWNIDVTTSPGGVVTLAGADRSDADRAEAVKIASATDGVTGLTIAPWQGRGRDDGDRIDETIGRAGRRRRGRRLDHLKIRRATSPTPT